MGKTELKDIAIYMKSKLPDNLYDSFDVNGLDFMRREEKATNSKYNQDRSKRDKKPTKKYSPY